jgi:hypothetical protein
VALNFADVEVNFCLPRKQKVVNKKKKKICTGNLKKKKSTGNAKLAYFAGVKAY